MNMRVLLLAMGLCLMSATAYGQSNKTIRELEAKRTNLQKQIAQTDSLLKTNRRNVGSQLNALNMLTAQLAERKRLVDAIAADIDSVDTQIHSMDRQLAVLQRQLKQQRSDYEASVLYLYRNRNLHSRLMFILSADKFSQMMRRLRYVREMGDYQQRQGEDLMKKQDEVSAKQTELKTAREEKAQLLSAHDREVKEMEGQEHRQQQIVKDLRSQQRTLQTEIAKQRRQAEQLNNQIDKYIAAEVERQRKEAERAEKARRQTAAKQSADKGKTSASKQPARQQSQGSETYNAAKPDAQLSANFASNRGKLPLPITGPYIITSHYGQYNVQGLRNVVLDNKGINIQGKPGAQARAVFNGTVVAVFKLNGLYNILVRHGEYISVYCNLASVSVKQDDKVSTRQSLGTVYSDSSDGGRTTLHFQLRREKEKLNPEVWLMK